MYKGEPQRVSARVACARCRAKPKSAAHEEHVKHRSAAARQSTACRSAPIFNTASGPSEVSSKFCGFKSRWMRLFAHKK